MQVFPAIDLRGGQVVRLRQGDPAAQTIWASDPARIAEQWVGLGAEWLHVVNLDGAFEGDAREGASAGNLAALQRILESVSVPVQFGGGVRDLESIERLLRLGLSRVVLGTVAIQRPQIVREAVQRFGAQHIVVGLDARAGAVASHGWTVQSGRSVAGVASEMRALGVEHAVFTDIERDGMLQGVNVEAARELARGSGLKVIASGGVASLDDISRLKAVEPDGVEGVIIGQALYTGAIDLRQALAAAA